LRIGRTCKDESYVGNHNSNSFHSSPRRFTNHFARRIASLPASPQEPAQKPAYLIAHSKGCRAAGLIRAEENSRAARLKFAVTKVTPSGHRSHYDNSHDLSVVNVMTRLWRNSLEAAAAVGTIVLATLIVHLVMSWWSASAALH
jgi:predicted alpha/beta hydrolase